MTRAVFPTACAVEDSIEQEEKGNCIDDPTGDPDIQLPEGVEEMLQKEEDILEQIPMPGVPGDEKARRKVWLEIPRRARVAIRKMHQEWGHMPKTVMINIPKTAKAPKEFIEAATNMLCPSCVVSQRKKQTAKVGPPRFNYRFNHEVGVDVFDLHVLQQYYD